MLIGYARVSTQDQKLDMQIDALIKAGCDKDRIFTDKITGSSTQRSGLDECLKYLRSGDTLVVWKLDRLGRSTRHLLSVVHDLEIRGVQFQSLRDQIDTSTPAGRLFFTMAAAFAEFERDVIRDRVITGIAAARARGRSGGRQMKMNSKKLAMAKGMLLNPEVSVREAAKTLGVSKSSLYAYLKNEDLLVEREKKSKREPDQG